MDKTENVKCPHCGYQMPIRYTNNANANGLFVKCKGRSCGKIFKIRIVNGEQVK